MDIITSIITGFIAAITTLISTVLNMFMGTSATPSVTSAPVAPPAPVVVPPAPVVVPPAPVVVQPAPVVAAKSVKFYAGPNYTGKSTDLLPFNYVTGGNFCSSYSTGSSATNCRMNAAAGVTTGQALTGPAIGFIPLSLKFFNSAGTIVPAPSDLTLLLYGWYAGSNDTNCGPGYLGVTSSLFQDMTPKINSWIQTKSGNGYVMLTTA